jgi:hypothetical protein
MRDRAEEAQRFEIVRIGGKDLLIGRCRFRQSPGTMVGDASRDHLR